MSDAIQCDNCEAVIYANDSEARTWWIQLGWRDGLDLDACSEKCARALLSWMRKQRVDIEADCG